jgi:hypothetical protein
VIDVRAFREAIRTVTVSYPIPFIVCVRLAFALACFVGALIASDILRWLFAGSGIASLLAALVLVGYGVFGRPDLLRSERFTLLSRYFEVIGDSTMTPEARGTMNLLLATMDDESRKGPAEGASGGTAEDEETSND